MRYRDSSPLKTISPCPILRTLKPESACRIREQYGQKNAWHSVVAWHGNAQERRSALNTVAQFLTLGSAYNLTGGNCISPLRCRSHRCKDASLFEAFSCPWTPPSTYYKLLENGTRPEGVWCAYTPGSISWDSCCLVWRQDESRPASDQCGTEAATPVPVIAPGAKQGGNYAPSMGTAPSFRLPAWHIFCALEEWRLYGIQTPGRTPLSV